MRQALDKITSQQITVGKFIDDHLKNMSAYDLMSSYGTQTIFAFLFNNIVRSEDLQKSRQIKLIKLLIDKLGKDFFLSGHSASGIDWDHVFGLGNPYLLESMLNWLDTSTRVMVVNYHLEEMKKIKGFLEEGNVSRGSYFHGITPSLFSRYILKCSIEYNLYEGSIKKNFGHYGILSSSDKFLPDNSAVKKEYVRLALNKAVDLNPEINFEEVKGWCGNIKGDDILKQEILDLITAKEYLTKSGFLNAGSKLQYIYSYIKLYPEIKSAMCGVASIALITAAAGACCYYRDNIDMTKIIGDIKNICASKLSDIGLSA
ncbi:MAG: hypothetical protein K0R73_740 [Candidatus Midichloriaceae bacterium]|jgi:hypothetical protein|nr:hypothetical protein [Candidatus Midichloriaceae bacterium]